MSFSVSVVLRRSSSTSAGGTYSKEKLRLLTYPMALALPEASVPLLKRRSGRSGGDNGDEDGEGLPLATMLSCFHHAGGEGGEGRTALDHSRRWVRDADELCVASMHRSNNVNRINSYVASYKLHDPQWRALLLPEVHVLPCEVSSSTGEMKKTDLLEDDTANAIPASSSSSPSLSQAIEEGGGDGSGGFSGSVARGAAEPSLPAYDIYVDYNKLRTIELLSRHANYALRHLVQKGHAVYFANFAQHSILEMRGLVEASVISCAYGIRGERLRTHMLHTGPLDVRDVIEVDPRTRRVSFNLFKKGVRRGVVAVSQIEGYGTWFQRKPMLWQRTRRIGALQSQLGAYEYNLCPAASVGRVRDYEVSLLEQHVRFIGSSAGAEAVGMLASSQVAQNDRLYLGQFEAPAVAAVDAVHQLCHRSALRHKLVRAPPSITTSTDMGLSKRAAELAELRQLLPAEKLLPVSWVTRTPPPYVPLEADLPFKVQLSKPAVFPCASSQQSKKREGSEAAAPVVFPTGGTVGSPIVKGVPLSLFEYNIHQGVDHYVFDDAPSARPMKWWNQKSNMPYNGYLYCMRSGLLDYVEPAESFNNPLATKTVPSSASSAVTQRRKRQQRRRKRQQAAQKRYMKDHETDEAAAAVAAKLQQEDVDDAETAGIHEVETWSGAGTDLEGHDSQALAEEADLVAAEEAEQIRVQTRSPLHSMIPPNELAERRAERYAAMLERKEGVQGVSDCRSTSSATTALAQRMKRRRMKHAQRRAAKRDGDVGKEDEMVEK